MYTWRNNRHPLVILSFLLFFGYLLLTDYGRAYAAGGSISGTVTDEEGNPLTNVGVQTYINSPNTVFWEPTGIYGITDPAGQYTITDIIPGLYRVSFIDGGWPLTYASKYYTNALNLEDAATITVVVSETVTIDAQLAKASRIEGIISDANGNPLGEIQISLWLHNSTNPTGWISPIRYTTTDSNGTYAFEGVDIGAYQMLFTDTRSPHSYSTEYYENASLLQATDIIVSSEEVFVINAELDGTGAVAGKVTSEDGTPLSGISVVVDNDIENDGWNSTIYLRGDVTDEKGVYTITGVHTGLNRICFSDYTYLYADECYDDAPTIQRAIDVTITAGATFSANAQLVRRSGISGTVTNSAGNPLPFQQVMLYIDPEDDGTWISDATRWTYTDETGVYTFTGLNPDTYRVWFHDPSGQFNAPEFYSDALTIDTAQNVTVTPGTITPNVNAQMEPFSHVTGKVTDDQNQPLNNMRVSAYGVAADITGSLYWGVVSTTDTDGNGIYNLTGLTSGSYYIEFSDPFNYWHSEFYDDAGYRQTGDRIAISRAMTITNINAQLLPFDQLNYPPYAESDIAYVNEGGTTNTIHMPWGPEWTLLINDRDAETELTAMLVMSPTHGTLTLNANGMFTYTHDASETTQDFFTYRAFDGVNYSNFVTVTVSITPVFDLPIAVSDAIFVANGGIATKLTSGATSLLANDTNPEGQPLTATLVSSPRHGVVVLSPTGIFTYTHDGSYSTQDRFAYRAETVNGFVSTPTTVTITIKPAISIEFTKTVWIDGLADPCGITSTLRVPLSTTVAYCYTVQNSGIITLTQHDLVDNAMGTILTDAPYMLTPGADYSVVVTKTIDLTTISTATWIAASSHVTTMQPVAATASATVTLSSPTDDQDNDGIPDVVELVQDIDHDNLPNFLDPDADGDSVLDRIEMGTNPLTPSDANNDGVPDYLDPFVPYSERLYLPMVRR